ncbi:MAG: bifunctional 5,10-methylenetetrahydrofolate dehydrogenase/5,10-methenyltetrahydrofolate cyclohydrolase [Bdellovibrionales bacterium]
MTQDFQLLDGKKVAAIHKETLRSQVAEFVRAWGRKPSLHVVLVGEDPASQIYVGLKEKMGLELGFESKVWRWPADISQKDLETEIRRLSQDSGVDAILVQMPLPAHLKEEPIIDLIPFEKDVDGFTKTSLGALARGRALAVSCTPAGVMELLKHYQIDVAGLHCVVVGRSLIVGKPMALLLLNADATVTVCHSRTRNLQQITKSADLVVVAAGKPGLLGAEDFKKGAIVLDVGIHRDGPKKVRGDVRFEGLDKVAKAASPVPGGVGPMTIMMLMQNTLRLAQARQEKK